METAAMDLLKQAEDPKVARALDGFLTRVVSKGASEARIVPKKGELQAEIGPQGQAGSSKNFPGGLQSAVIARIKSLAGLDPNEHQRPQSGQMIVQNDSSSLRFRVSTKPVFDGEEILLRRLGGEEKVLTFEQLGFLPQTLAAIKINLTKPQGLTLVAGPAGSGKTTTLYSLLAKLNTRGISISTVEDPIEHQLPGANQMQVAHESGMSLASGIRAALKSDSDAVMVGEIDDEYTLEEALHAAATGRMLLSTFAADGAAAAVAGLLDFKIEPYQIAYTLNAVLAQRLVKKLCPSCKAKTKLVADTQKRLEENFDLEKLAEAMKKQGVASSSADLEFYVAQGCKECDGSGYSGRMGVFEILEIDEAMAELILTKPSAEQIFEQAQQSGMISLRQNALIKAHLGLTSVEEALSLLKN